MHQAVEGALCSTRAEEGPAGATDYAVVVSADMQNGRGDECRRGREGGQGAAGGGRDEVVVALCSPKWTSTIPVSLVRVSRATATLPGHHRR